MENWKSHTEQKDPFFQRSYLRPLFVNVRCPECQKLYRIDTRDIISSDPRFDCVKCHVTFKVETDPSSSRSLLTRTDSKISLSKLTRTQLTAEAIRPCPKCGASHLNSQLECLKCGIIFEKYEKAEREGGVIPSLSKAWSDLLNDYNNVTKHILFVDQCVELEAIPYALKKYNDLKEIQPFDPIATEMHNRVLLKKFSHKSFDQIQQKIKRFAFMGRTLDVLAQLPWMSYFKVITWIIPLLFFVWGIFVPHLRNLIGFGVSLLFLRFAIAIFVYPQFEFKTFWRY